VLATYTAKDDKATRDWPHIVLADGRLYCKDRLGNLKCLVIGGSGGS
jgi:hypothetical protein